MGLYDMQGNVWEWCQDFYHENYNVAPTNGAAWVTGGDLQSRVLRGGSWDYSLVLARAVARYYLYPLIRDSNIGFRVVVRPLS